MLLHSYITLLLKQISGPRDASDSFAIPPCPMEFVSYTRLLHNCQYDNYGNDNIRDATLPAGETAVRKIPLPSPCSALAETSPLDVEVFDQEGFSAMEPIASGSGVDFLPDGRECQGFTATPLRGAATSRSPRHCRRSSDRTASRGRKAD